ncbi:MAG: hypothetical protein AB4911_02300 [Oscillochloridaceae bacterium umkhey_bin13]
MHPSAPNEHVVINWHYPPPRDAFDRFIGPGATRAEILLQFVPTLLIALTLIAVAIIKAWGWTPVQLIVAGLLMLDMVGGVITNATSAGKRWYHVATCCEKSRTGLL